MFFSLVCYTIVRKDKDIGMALSICLCIILGVVVLDQLTKIIFMGINFRFIPKLIHFVPKLNDGAAFSSLSGERWFFIIFTILALGLMFYLLITKKWSKHPLFLVTLSIMIGGVIGNFIDRLFFGVVRDFVYIVPMGFVCNVADIAITAACVMFVVYLFFIRDKEEKRAKEMLAEEVSKSEQKD